MSVDDLRAKIREVPDFPKPGILFRDITTLLSNLHGFRAAIDDFLTAQATFDTGWSQAATSLEFPLDRDTVTLATVPQISDSKTDSVFGSVGFNLTDTLHLSVEARRPNDTIISGVGPSCAISS